MSKINRWSAPGCKGVFYIRGKNKIIWYQIDRKRRSLGLIYGKQNKEIAADIVRKEELTGLSNLSINTPKNNSEAWIEFKESHTQKKFNTINNTKLALNSLIGEDFNLDQLENISSIIEQRIISTTLSPRSVNSYLASLKAYFNWMIEKKYILENPIIKNLKIKIPDKKIEIYSDVELQAIFDFWKGKNTEMYLFLNFLYETAFRINEALTLKWKQVINANKWYDSIFLEASKFGDRKESFPLSEAIINILKQVKTYTEKPEQQNSVFSMPNKRNINKLFDNALKELEIPKRLQYDEGNGRAIHTIRKTRITHWVVKQHLPEIVVEKLSRDNYETVRKYYANLDIMDLQKHLKSFSDLKEKTSEPK